MYKRLINGLFLACGALVAWRIAKLVSLMSYSRKGPFVNSSSPGIDQAFLNGLEQYLNSGATKSGVPIVSWFGPYTVTTTPTFFNHNLKDQNNTSITPDTVMLVVSGTSTNTYGFEWDPATITSTQVKLTTSSGPGITIWGTAYKF